MTGRRAVPSTTAPPDELARLRKRIDQQERSLAALVPALSALRDANTALREQNRELHLELDRVRRANRTSREAVPTADATGSGSP